MYWPLPLTASELISADCTERVGKEVEDRDQDDSVDSADATLNNLGSVPAKGRNGDSSSLC